MSANKQSRGIVQRFFTFLDSFQLTNHQIGIALSAGADSTSLLLAAAEANRADKAKFVALHVDHGVRIDSAKDAQVARESATAAGLPCEIAALALQPGSSEAAMREGRYGALAVLAEKLGLAGVMTAHHARDQAETVLLHLIRGSGSEGLSAMAPDETLPTSAGPIRILRPFLREDPDELRRLLDGSGLSIVVDPSNLDQMFTRNRLRQATLPELRSINPGAEGHIANAAEIVRAESRLLNEMTQVVMDVVVEGDILLATHVANLDIALQRRAIRTWARNLTGIDLTFDRSEAIRQLAISGKGGVSIQIGEGWTAHQSRRRITLQQFDVGSREHDIDS